MPASKEDIARASLVLRGQLSQADGPGAGENIGAIWRGELWTLKNWPAIVEALVELPQEDAKRLLDVLASKSPDAIRDLVCAALPQDSAGADGTATGATTNNAASESTARFFDIPVAERTLAVMREGVEASHRIPIQHALAQARSVKSTCDTHAARVLAELAALASLYEAIDAKDLGKVQASLGELTRLGRQASVDTLRGGSHSAAYAAVGHPDGPGAVGDASNPVDAAILRALLEYGADRDLGNRYGTTPLMRSVQWRHGLCLDVMLGDPRTNVDLRDSFGKGAVHYAVDWNDVGSIGKLHDHGARFDMPPAKSDHVTPLGLAVVHGYAEAVGKMLALGALPDGPDKYGRTPLGLNAEAPFRPETAESRVAIASMLVSAGANPNAQHGDRPSVAHALLDADRLNPQLVAFMVEAGANFDAPRFPQPAAPAVPGETVRQALAAHGYPGPWAAAAALPPNGLGPTGGARAAQALVL